MSRRGLGTDILSGVFVVAWAYTVHFIGAWGLEEWYGGRPIDSQRYALIFFASAVVVVAAALCLAAWVSHSLGGSPYRAILVSTIVATLGVLPYLYLLTAVLFPRLNTD